MSFVCVCVSMCVAAVQRAGDQQQEGKGSADSTSSSSSLAAGKRAPQNSTTGRPSMSSPATVRKPSASRPAMSTCVARA